MKSERVTLDQVVTAYVADGYRVDYMSEQRAVLSIGGKTSSNAHAWLTIFTCGLWLIPWFFIELGHVAKTKRVVFEVLPGGVVRKVVSKNPRYNRYGFNNDVLDWFRK
jgi:hypothetical protein